MKKFNIAIIFGMMILTVLIFSVPTANTATPVQGSSADTLLVGTTSFGSDLDPQNAWDSASFDIIQQVSEGLFFYDLGDPFLRIVPRLAADCGTWSEDHLEFTVQLRQNVTFHNGHAFNATAVKASFDRLNHLIGIGKLQSAELYKPLNDELVINETVVIDEYKVKFILNYQFFPFEYLLCFTGSMIVDASVMPANDIIHKNDTLIGTGPYKFVGNDGEKVEFTYHEEYYRGVPAVKNFTYIKYESTTAISTALLAGDVHMGSHDPDFLSSFEASDILTVEEQKIGSIITYMSMNNVEINKTMRQAISYAMDYRYIIEAIYRNKIIRMTTVIPPSIKYHYPQEVATYDVDKARQILIDARLSKGLDEDSEDSEWIALAESDDPIASYNYTYNLGNVIREDIGIETKYDLKQIGIQVELSGVTEDEFLTKHHFFQDKFQLILSEWKPDYKDPSNCINTLLSNTSSYTYNTAQVNDPWLQEKMMEGLTDFNKTTRKLLYYEIQKYIAEDLMPWVFIGFNYDILVHSANVIDIQRNTYDYFYVFPLTWYGNESEWEGEYYCDEYYYDGGSTPWDITPVDTQSSNRLLGYNILVMLGVATAMVIFILRKRKRNDG